MKSLLTFFSSKPLPSNRPDSGSPTRPSKNPRKNNNLIYCRALPLSIHPLPAFIPSNPLSYLRIACALSEYWTRPTSHAAIHHGYYSPATRAVHVTDEVSIRALWEQGFFGKGSLSRSEPEWLERERRRLGLSEGARTAGDVTDRRRQERRAAKRERARVEREELKEQLRKEGTLLNASNGHAQPPSGTMHVQQTVSLSSTIKANDPGVLTTPSEPISPDHSTTELAQLLQNREHLQLSPHEALFLSHTLGVLQIHPSPSPSSSPSHPISSRDLLHLFRRTQTSSPCAPTTQTPPDDPFTLNYAVYQHFRSLGWVVRPGIKFAVDWLLYARGPVFAHAEFAVVVLPSYTRCVRDGTGADADAGEGAEPKEHAVWREKCEWWWLHAVSRVQTQVMKSLVLCYVDVPTPEEVQAVKSDPTALVRLYRVREFVVRRWTPNRNRD